MTGASSARSAAKATPMFAPSVPIAKAAARIDFMVCSLKILTVEKEIPPDTAACRVLFAFLPRFGSFLGGLGPLSHQNASFALAVFPILRASAGGKGHCPEGTWKHRRLAKSSLEALRGWDFYERQGHFPPGAGVGEPS